MIATSRRLDVLDGLWRGLGQRQIAAELGVRVGTVASDVRTLRRDGVTLPPARLALPSLIQRRKAVGNTE